VELNDANHLILKEDDIIGILETDDAKDMKPLSDRVLIKVQILYTFIYVHLVCMAWMVHCCYLSRDETLYFRLLRSSPFNHVIIISAFFMYNR
jgi:hypothetical protein